MPVVTNVFRRGGSYYFRVRVPDHLAGIAGRRELWRSLRTPEANAARRRGTLLHGLTQRLWRDLECAMTHSESKALIDKWLRAEIDEDTYLRGSPVGERHVGVILRQEPRWKPDAVVATLDHQGVARMVGMSPTKRAEALGDGGYLKEGVTDRELAMEGQRKVYGQAAARLAAEDEDVAATHVRDLFERKGLPVDPFTDRFEVATRMMMRAHDELWRVIDQRNVAGWRQWLDDDPAADLLSRLPAPVPDQPAASVDARTPLPLSRAADVAVAEMTRLEGFKAKRVEDYENAVATFIAWHGEDPDLHSLSSATVGDFKNALTHYPSNVRKRLPYRDLETFAERLAVAKAAGEQQVLSPVTINGKYLTPLRRIIGWHRESGVSLSNPFDEVRVRTPKQLDPRKRRRDFTSDEVKRLFAQPLFTGSAGLSGPALYQPGTARVGGWRYWVPLICLFSGLRLNEACGLALADFKQEGGIAYMHVRDEAEGQSLKSDSARRMVPLHSELLALGLPALVASLRASGGPSERLFDDLTARNGYFSAKPSKFFNDLLPRILDEDPSDPGRLVFHSLRHTVISRLRAAEVRIDVAMEIVGHEIGNEKGSVHAGYGEYDIPMLKRAVDQIVYPGLDLSALRT